MQQRNMASALGLSNARMSEKSVGEMKCIKSGITFKFLFFFTQDHYDTLRAVFLKF